MKELIEQIGGRDKIEAIANYSQKYNVSTPAKDVALMARALLAVLDAQGKPPKELYNLEHFISFFIKVKAGLKPTPNDIDHTIWFLEGLSSLLTSPEPGG